MDRKNPYNNRAWRLVRKEVLERDSYLCRIHGPRCTGTATEADHIVPWEDGGAFYDLANLRAACKRCNVGRSNTQKHREGWRRGKAHIVLVMGPPGSGKTTYANNNAGPSDLIVDYDAISESLGPQTAHAGGRGRHVVTMAARNAIIQQIRRGEVEAKTIYFLSANPRAESMFPFHEVVLVDPGRDEVLRRVGQQRPMHFVRIVDEWYAARQPASVREW